MQITNVPSGTRFFGPSGEFLILQIDYTRGWMALWNQTDCGLQNAVIGTPDYGSWGNTAHGNADPTATDGLGPFLNGTNPRCYSWNVTIPKGLGTTSGIGGAALKIYIEDRIVGMMFNRTNVNVWALDISKGHEGALLFNKNWTPPAEWNDGSNTLAYTQATNYVSDDTYGNGVIAVWDKEQRTHYGFSVLNWITTSGQQTLKSTSMLTAGATQSTHGTLHTANSTQSVLAALYTPMTWQQAIQIGHTH